jgi:hypothetical protein
MDWTVKPLVGIGDITFGMRPNDVLNQMEVSPSRAKSSNNRERLSFDKNFEQNITFLFQDGILCELGIGRENLFASIYGMPVFSDPQRTLEELKRKVSSVHEMLGFLIFDEIGITLTGVHDGAIEDQAITAYAPGRWDKIIPRAKIWFQSRS